MIALRGFALLLLCQALGDVLTRGLGLLVPGPVTGLLLLFAALFWAPLRAPVEAAATTLLGHLSLLFVPVGVGIIVHLGLLARYGVALMATILVSTAVGIAVTGWVLDVLLRHTAAGDHAGPGDAHE
ncbi:CidA/LrgA family protein [uncultured Sphaerotilus sp.]|uniref:CidA/LrgA family protein n=1 Tax=uncultured Sphaerotilus sp. TaxID=474984 RepID=UPI0030CA47E8